MRMRFPSLVAAGLFLLPSLAFAQSVNFRGIDVMTQTVKQEGQSTISGLGIRLRMQSDDLPAGLTLVPTLEHWRDSDRLQDFNIRATQRDLTLGLDGRYDWQWGNWRPYAGAGLGAHFIKTTFEAPDLGVAGEEETRTKVGPDVLVGLQLSPIAWLQSFAEAKYYYVPPFRQFKLNWGLGINF